MKKVIVFIGICMGLYSHANANILDSSHHKFRKNQFEMGKAKVNFLNDHVYKWHKVEPTWIPLYLKYTRHINPNLSISAKAWTFLNSYGDLYDDLYVKGNVIERVLIILNISPTWSQDVLTRKNVRINAFVSANINYRTGHETIFLAVYPGGFDWSVDRNLYNSMGLGIGVGSNIIIKNRITVGFDYDFNYFFQKKNLGTEPKYTEFYKNYKPNRMMLSFHPKIGVLF